MAAKKYQVFVSSTFRDLVEERQDAIRNILDLNHIPAGMELFPAADLDQLVYIKKVIDECDYYLLIVGGRYGSMDEDGVSYTEREYDYAVEKGMVVLAFVHDDLNSISVGKSDIKPEVAAALGEFRSKVMTGRLVKTWTSRQQLEPLVLKALMHSFNSMPQVGWIRGNAAASDHLLEQSNAALQENAQLRLQIAKLTNEQPTELQNLADLNDDVRIRFRTSYTPTRGRTLYESNAIDLKLIEIFLRSAADLSTAKTDLTIVIASKGLIKERTGDLPHDIHEMDIAMLKAQFIALGLLDSRIGRSVKDTIHEYLSLTAKGSRVYMEHMVVRKPTS